MSRCADRNAAAVWEIASYKALGVLTSELVRATNMVVPFPLKQLLRWKKALVPQLLQFNIVAVDANTDSKTAMRNRLAGS